MSMSTLLAYQVVPAKAAVASWLQHVLDPVIAACRFSSPPPIELRPTGSTWRGWCESFDMAPDGRVCLSGRARFWSRHELIAVYLHEAAHRLLPGQDHDPMFACVAHALLLRADTAGLTAHAASVYTNLYNIADDLPDALAEEPDQGLGRSLAWSVLTACELAVTELVAEDLAAEVVRRFDEWLVELADEPVLRAQAVRSASLAQMAQGREVERFKDKLFISNFLAGISSFLLVLTVVMLWQ